MSTIAAGGCTFEEYLRIEEQSEERHEFLDGEVRRMTGGTEPHCTICQNFAWRMGSLVDGLDYRVYSHGMRVLCPSGLWTYSDIFVVAGKPECEGGKKNHTIIYPTLIIEVLSPSTEQYDRGEKFEHYKSIPTLTEYLLVAQDRIAVKAYRRGETGSDWNRELYGTNAEEIPLQSLGVTLPVEQIYQYVEFSDESAAE